jgi:hypothetical protein
MRVPVRMPIQYLYTGPAVRRAVAPSPRRLHALDAYGGDVRLRDPLSLVFHGGLGQDVPAIEMSGVPQTYDISPAPVVATTADILTSPSEPYVAAEPPVTTTADILTSGGSPAYVAPAPVPDSWWTSLERAAGFLPAITASAAIASQIARGAATGGATSYVIPATATTPAQRVTYNPATGQITTTPITAAAGGLPGFLQAAPGAAWYQNPLVLVGGGLVVVLVLLMASKRR